jgi:2-pyrone-4,6-dicarboxylate lactonase
MSERFSKPIAPPRASRYAVPAGAIDCHGHIFEDQTVFPIADPSMPLAGIEDFFAVHDAMGMHRGVLVQGGAYKLDNSAMIAALRRFPDRLRGVALVGQDTSISRLAELHGEGVRALRFTRDGPTPMSFLQKLAPGMREIGLHVELYAGLTEFLDVFHVLDDLGLRIVLDHLGGPYHVADHGVTSAAFRKLIELVGSKDIWIKLTPQRVSGMFPHYEDARGHFDAIISAIPNRVVWGSDWPFPNMSEATPHPTDLLDLFIEWTPKDVLRRILVDNAERLYGFAPWSGAR